ncbi:MAG TPA: histidine kinase dimerization/phospho-acceptor domain-containing protein, partial [Chlamydiales bacterium]|nr:histidine kinase dimerization/phospho-acceptor domain-containing protein [Chlamydiales bacterium]
MDDKESPLLSELEKALELIEQAENAPAALGHLKRASLLFTEETEKLRSSYAKLNAELEKTNLRFLQKAQELNTLSQYLNSVLKNISQGLIFISNKDIILTFNDAAAALIERDMKELLLKRYSHQFKDDFFGFSMEDALHFGLALPVSYITFHSEERGKREIEVTTSFVHEGIAPYQGIILLLRDITDMKRLQEISSRNDRLKALGEMVSTVAHEIKNPLGGIRGYATLLSRELEGNNQLQEMSGHIIEGTKTLDRLLSKVLHFARPIQVLPSSLDLSAFIRQVCKFVKMDPAFPKNVQIDTHISQDPLFVPFDAEAFRSALLNLMVNAFQAMPQGGVITVSLLKQDPNCLLSISDTGIGIEEKVLP